MADTHSYLRKQLQTIFQFVSYIFNPSWLIPSRNSLFLLSDPFCTDLKWCDCIIYVATKELNSTVTFYVGLCITNLWDKFTFAYLCNDSARNSTTVLRKESTVPLCGIIINTMNKNSRKYHIIFWTYHLYSISEEKLYWLFIKSTMQFTPTHRCLWGAYGLFWMCVYAFRWEILRKLFSSSK